MPTPKITRKHLVGGASAAAIAAAIAIASPMISGFESERHRVYRDVVGIATYCDGETKNPDWSKTYSHEECMALLGGRLEEFNAAIDSCVYATLTTHQRAASLSFTYNLGAGAFCGGSIARNFNAGNPQAACDAMLQYDHAGKDKNGKPRVIRGLTIRRQAEREVCLTKD